MKTNQFNLYYFCAQSVLESPFVIILICGVWIVLNGCLCIHFVCQWPFFTSKLTRDSFFLKNRWKLKCIYYFFIIGRISKTSSLQIVYFILYCMTHSLLIFFFKEDMKIARTHSWLCCLFIYFLKSSSSKASFPWSTSPQGSWSFHLSIFSISLALRGKLPRQATS